MALSSEDIQKIVNRFAAKRKGWEQMTQSTPLNPITKQRASSQYPEYWSGYNYAAKMYDSILPHSRSDVYPEHLLSVRAPNQTDAQALYIKANYKATTLSVFEDFRSTISRAFADQNWSIRYSPELDERFGEETFQRYVNNEIEKFGSLEMFIKNMLPTLKLVDANGIIAIYPDDIEYLDEEEFEEPVMGNELLRPMPTYYNCKNIVGQKFGEYYLVISDDHSYVKVGSKMEESGIVLYLYDQNAIYKIEQTGKKSDMTFSEPVLYFQHNLGYVPCIKLMGSPQLINDEIAFQSPFITAVPLLDQVVLDESYLQMSKATSAFPFMVALGEICEFVDREGNRCNDGQIFDPINGGYRTCGSCSGSGVKSRFSPTGMLLIKPKTSVSDGDSGLSGEYLKFVSPPMDTLTFLRTEIEQQMSKSRRILHLPSSDESGTIGEASTATGSLNKLRSLYAFIKPISDQLFTIYEFCLVTIGKMRYGDLFGGVNLVYPTSFDISTPSDYLAVISEGVKAGVPPSITFSNVYNYIRAIHYTDEETSAVYDLIINADELLLMSNADILARLASGSVEKWQDVLHNSGPQLIMELIRDFIPTEGAERFLDLPMSEQIAALRAKAAEKIAVTLDPIQQAQQTLLNGIV
jgi:hypothetical protein